MKKRADGRYQIKVSTPEGPKVVYGKSKAEARRKEAEVRQRLAAGAPVRDAQRSLEDWLNEWVKTSLKVSNRAEATKNMHAHYCRTWIIPTLGAITLANFRPNDVTVLMAKMQDAGRSDSTRRNCYTVLRVALDDAVINGLLASNPVHKVKQPRVTRVEAHSLKPEEARSLVRHAHGLRYADVLKLILLTGMRRGEACGLRWDDIDLESGQAHVKRSLIRLNGSLQTVDTKTTRSRRGIALSDDAVALLRVRLEVQRRERAEAANRWEDHGFVFCSKLGKPLDPDNLRRTVREAAAKAGLTGVTVHTLRHTYASAALMARVPLKVVSDNMGHASIQITADTYGHVPEEAARSGASTVSRAFGF